MKKIMVVDDDPNIVYSIKNGLCDEYEIMIAESGKQFFNQLEIEIPDIILLDIIMPEMSGWKIIEKLKENEKWANIPIVLITGRKDKVVENAGRFYAEDFIEKPFTLTDLKNSIDKIFKLKR